MFTIRTSGDFFENLLEEFEDFQENPLSARHAVNCAISAYHMHEWVWGDWLRMDDSTKISLGVTDKDSFVEWIDRHEPFFRAIAHLANGSKHFTVARLFVILRWWVPSTMQTLTGMPSTRPA